MEKNIREQFSDCFGTVEIPRYSFDDNTKLIDVIKLIHEGFNDGNEVAIKVGKKRFAYLDYEWKKC